MKKKELTDLRKKDIKGQEALLEEKRRALLVAIAASKTGNEKNVKRPRNLRLEIAQISTIIREGELIAEKGEIA